MLNAYIFFLGWDQLTDLKAHQELQFLLLFSSILCYFLLYFVSGAAPTIHLTFSVNTPLELPKSALNKRT